MKKYDVIVIGGGPAGYVAAIRCSQLGLETACVESWLSPDSKPALGGTCLNVGCIPSKALLDSSHHYSHIRNHAADHGVQIDNVRIDVGKMISRKDMIIKTLTGGIASLFKKHKIDWLQGHGQLAGGNEVYFTPHDGSEKQSVFAEHIILATGSVPASIPQADVDNDGPIINSTGALALKEVPGKLGVIGAGVIGLELGSVWNRLGSDVVILEAMDTFLPAVDQKIAREARKSLKKQGLDIRLAAQVSATEITGNDVRVTYKDGDGEQQLEFNKLVVAVGRKPNTTGLGVEAVGLKLDERGFIPVDDQCQTSIKGIWAIGDVVRGPMLAHKAMEEGVAVAERIAGQTAHLNYEIIPWVIYTWPEIAWVGKTEESLKKEGIEYRSGAFPFMASGRAHGMGETQGLVKMLADKATDKVLGVHILGPNASELLAEAVTAMAFDATSADIAQIIHAHPTLSEAIHEAALDVDDRTLHM